MRSLLVKRKTSSVSGVTITVITRGLIMSNGNDYQGAIDSAKQLARLGKRVYNFYVGPKIPKDPEEIIRLAEQVKKEEELFDKAEKAKEYIKKTWQERDQKARAARRAKLRKIFHIKKD